MEAKEINITLPAQAVQYVLNVLAERPYREANEVIAAIMSQANAQLSVQNPVAPSEEGSGG